MMRYIVILVFLLTNGNVAATDKTDVKAIIEATYPGAEITEIEKERFKGKEVYEVDFRHDGRKLEAIVSLEGEIVKVGQDD